MAIKLEGDTADIDTYYLDKDLCNSTMYMADYNGTNVHTFLLKVSAEEHYPHNLRCLFTAQAQNTEYIMLYFKAFSVGDDKCEEDWLELHDGNLISSPYVCGINDIDGKLCGQFPSRLRSVYITSTHYLTLFFESGNEETFTGFEMVITRFRYAQCRSDEFGCENGRCIDKSITCNKHNPCGDKSDCGDGSCKKSGCIYKSLFYIALGFVIVLAVGSCVMTCHIKKNLKYDCRTFFTVSRHDKLNSGRGESQPKFQGHGGMPKDQVPEAHGSGNVGAASRNVEQLDDRSSDRDALTGGSDNGPGASMVSKNYPKRNVLSGNEPNPYGATDDTKGATTGKPGNLPIYIG